MADDSVGRVRRIPHIWAYMLLGQIVAISFAQSLFFVAVGLYDLNNTGTPLAEAKRSRQQVSSPWMSALTCRMWHWLVVAMVLYPVAVIPSSVHKPRFLLVLSIPHVALMLLPIVEVGLIPQYVYDESKAFLGEGMNEIYRAVTVLAGIWEAKTVSAALKDTSPERHLHRHSAVFSNPLLNSTYGAPIEPHLWDVLGSLYDHPAVTSVGWDVLLCSAIYGIWRWVQRQQKSGSAS